MASALKEVLELDQEKVLELDRVVSLFPQLDLDLFGLYFKKKGKTEEIKQLIHAWFRFLNYTKSSYRESLYLKYRLGSYFPSYEMSTIFQNLISSKLTI